MSKVDLALHEKLLLEVNKMESSENLLFPERKAPATDMEIEMYLEVYAYDQVYIDSCGSKKTYHFSSRR